MYITSPQCPSPILLNNYLISQFLENDFLLFDDSYISSTCLKTVNYKICTDLSYLSNKYEISYIISYESGMNIAKYGNNTLTYKHPFSINSYLTKSPKCFEHVDLRKFDVFIDFKCIIVTSDLLPENSRDDDNDSSSINRSISLPMIAGISGIALVVIVIIVGVIVIVSKRKKINLILILLVAIFLMIICNVSFE